MSDQAARERGEQPGVVRQAERLLKEGVELRELNRSRDAVAVYDELLARFTDAPDRGLREQVAKALLNKGVALGDLQLSHEEIAAYDELIARFAGTPDPALREPVAVALLNKGLTLGELTRWQDALATYNELLVRFGDAPEGAVREQVAKALLSKHLALSELDRSQDAMAVYDDVLARFGDAPEAAVREEVAKVLLNEGVRLGGLSRPEQEISAYDELLTRFADRTEPALREPIAKALYNKGVALGELMRWQDAIDVYDELLARFADAAEAAICELIAKALYSKGVALGALNRPDEKIAVHGELLARFGSVREPPVCELDASVAPRPDRRMLRLAAAVLVGVAGIAGGLVLYDVLPDSEKQSGVELAFPPFLALVTLLLGAGMDKLSRRRRNRAVSAAELLAKDSRPPVLYLRSFRDDPAAGARTPLGTRTGEEQMVAVLRRIGPVVALRTPGGRDRGLGAARDYVPETSWKEWVLATMRAASLTVLRASNTDGFWWEVAMAAKHLGRDRTAFLLPQDAEKYAAFRARVTEYFPEAESLPQALPRLDPRYGSKLPERSLWGLLYFDAYNNPQLRSIALQAETVGGAIALALSISPRQPYRSVFESLFAPLLRRAGARARPTPQPLGIGIFLAAFYVLVPAYAWNRLKGRPAYGPPGLDPDHVPDPALFRDAWLRVFKRSVAPMSALIPIYVLATLLFTPSVAAAFPTLLFGLWLALPLIVTIMLVGDAKLIRHETFPKLSRTQRGIFVFLFGTLPALWAVVGALAGVTLTTYALAWAVFVSMMPACVASIGVYAEVFGSWRQLMRRARERRKSTAASTR